MAWFGCILVALLIAALVGDDRCVKAAAATLLGNWIANTAMAEALGSQTQWLVTATIDWASAIFLVIACTGRLRLVLAMSFAAQMVIHAAYGVVTTLNGVTYKTDVAYWDSLFAVAVMQVLIVGGWIVGGGLRRHRVSRRGQLHNPSMSVSVARRGSDE